MTNHIKHALEISCIGRMSKYFGFSTLVGREKIKAFGFVNDKVRKKVYGWRK